VNNAIGPESPLTPNLLEGNSRFDKYMQSKMMVWHNNKRRDVTIADQVNVEKALKNRKGGQTSKYTETQVRSQDPNKSHAPE